MNPQLEESWKSILQDEFSKDYMLKLKDFLVQEKQNNTIYPKGNQIFEAFQLTPFNKVKVVILGQDPYHGPGQAHGLSFSVPEGIPKPPSLENIFKEIQSDLGIPIPKSGSLVRWAEQGVLLLNAILTVRASQAASHRNQGWEQFTDAVLHQLNEKRENLVFMLWGNFARSKSKFLDPSKHCILESVHPSPLSAYQGFLGCKHFSSANHYLKQHGISPIQW